MGGVLYDQPNACFIFLISCHQCAAFKWGDGPLMCAEERLGLSGLLLPIIVKQTSPPPPKTENHEILIMMGFLLLTLQGAVDT